LPTYSLRNGRLNQTGFSLFFLIRDVARGDLAQWIGDQIALAGGAPGGQDVATLLQISARDAGLSARALTESLRDALAWERELGLARTGRKAGLDRADELAILEDARS